MAKKKEPEAPPPPTELLVPRDQAAARIGERMKLGQQLLDREVRTEEDYETLRNDHDKWFAFNREMLRRTFSTPELADEYSRFFGTFSMGVRSLGEKIGDLRNDIADAIHRLDSIKERLTLIPVSAGIESPQPSTKAEPVGSKVFLVHGHDERVREAAARFLEKLGLEAIILHEQPSGGRTVIEKLERYSDVSFAVVLLTPDDIGSAAGKEPRLSPRARQNVILELGYFVGRLGRDRVCALHLGHLELPSDYMGVVYVPFDEGGGWRLPLAKELRTAGFEIDMNKAL